MQNAKVLVARSIGRTSQAYFVPRLSRSSSCCLYGGFEIDVDRRCHRSKGIYVHIVYGHELIGRSCKPSCFFTFPTRRPIINHYDNVSRISCRYTATCLRTINGIYSQSVVPLSPALSLLTNRYLSRRLICWLRYMRTRRTMSQCSH